MKQLQWVSKILGWLNLSQKKPIKMLKIALEMSILFVLLIWTMIACSGEKDVSHVKDITPSVTEQTPVEEWPELKPREKKKLTKEEKRRRERAQEKRDSIAMSLALEDAIGKATHMLKQEKTTLTYEFSGVDSADIPFVEITAGHLFSEKYQHVYIKRKTWLLHFDIFLFEDNDLRLVLSRTLSSLNYIADSIYDVNGDQRSDFELHWYPSSGCCIRNIHDIHLSVDHGQLQMPLEFINPTFYPVEGIVRGVTYGHAGHVELYKVRWNQYSVDTLAFISHDPSTPGQFLKTKTNPYRANEIPDTLTSMPQEFLSIDAYNWFAEER